MVPTYNVWLVYQQGFNQEDLEGEKNKAQASAKKAVEDDSDSDDGVDRGGKE